MLAEGHSTKVTLEHLLVAGSLAVGLHVSGQLATLSARVRAKLAFVRFLSCVTSSVHRQVAAILKHFSAELTGIVLPTGHQLPAVLWVEKSLYLTFLHDRLDGARLHWRKVRGQKEGLLDWLLRSGISKQLAGWGPQTGGLS